MGVGRPPVAGLLVLVGGPRLSPRTDDHDDDRRPTGLIAALQPGALVVHIQLSDRGDT
jgi:hypothetical protein